MGRTIIFSSHVLSEIESTCDRVVIMRTGHIAHEQSIATLRRSHRIYAQLTGPLPSIPESLASSISIVKKSAGDVVMESTDSLTRVLDWLSGLPLSELKIEPVDLQLSTTVIIEKIFGTAIRPRFLTASQFPRKEHNFSSCGIPQYGGKHGEINHCLD